jgi:hypothetical protein
MPVTNNRIMIEKTGLNTGLYILSITGDKKIYTGKITIVK